MVLLRAPLSMHIQFSHCSGDGRRSRGEIGEEGSSSQEPPPKKLRSMTMKDSSHGNYDVVRVVGTQNRQLPH